jgi:hypothetical protein
MKVSVTASNHQIEKEWVGKCFVSDNLCSDATVFLCTGISETGNLDALILSSTKNEWKGKVGKIIRNFSSKNAIRPWYGKVELTFD